MEDEAYERAREIVLAALGADTQPGPPWRCQGCGEEIEGQFSACWHCGESRPLDRE